MGYLRFSAAVIAAFGLGAIGHGQLIDIATSDGDPAPTGAAVLGSAGDVWNTYNGTFGGLATQPVVDSTGATTAALFNFTCDGAVPSLINGTQPDPALTNFYIFNNSGGDVTAQFAGLASNQLYKLVLYVASNDGFTGQRAVSVTFPGTSSAPLDATGIPLPAFVNGQNIIQTMVMSSATGALNIDVAEGPGNAGTEVDLNGLQLQAVPEPAPLAGLGFGVLALTYRRKRRQVALRLRRRSFF